MHGVSSTSVAQQRTLPAPLSEGEQRALLLLLADDDSQIYHTVRQRILAEGDAAESWVEPATRSDDPALRRRAGEILRFLGRRRADDNFLAFCLNSGEDLDLEEGIFLLAKTQYPEINPDGYNAILDDYAADLRERLDFGSAAAQIIAG